MILCLPWFGSIRSTVWLLESFISRMEKIPKFLKSKQNKELHELILSLPVRISPAHSTIQTGLKIIQFCEVIELVKLFSQLKIEMLILIVANLCTWVISQPTWSRGLWSGRKLCHSTFWNSDLPSSVSNLNIGGKQKNPKNLKKSLQQYKPLYLSNNLFNLVQIHNKEDCLVEK